MDGRTLLRTLNAPIDTAPLKAIVRRVLDAEERPAFLAFAFLYFCVATNLLLLFAGSNAGLASILGVLSRAALQVLPLFALASAINFADVRTPVGRVGGVVLWVLLLAHIAICAVDFLAFLYFDQRMTPGVIFVLAETNFAESREFIGMYANLDLLLLAIFVALPFVAGYAVRRARFAPALRRAFVWGLLAASLVGLGQAPPRTPGGANPSLVFVRGVRDYREELRAYHEIERAVSGTVPGTVVSGSPTERNLHVLILGESTSRAHMSLYGYERKTTPRLEAMRGELYVFDDVVSPHSHTIPVLKKLLTFANNDSPGSWHEYPILFDVYRAAGFKSYWISNQEAYGIWGNAASVIGSRADVQIFHNRESSKALTAGLDGELLPYLDRILASDDASDQFIVLHLMGTHSNYVQRYPPEFDTFGEAPIADAGRDFLSETKKDRINEYDNAVLYNDHIVSRIIERVRSVDASAFVLYVSDHSEEVYEERDFNGHNETIGNHFMVEIPFILWLSPEYRATQAGRVAALKRNLRSPYMTDDLPHTLLDLSSISWDHWDPRRSLARIEFDAGRKRIYSGVDYDQILKRDRTPSLLRDPLGKVWAHRVNSIGKLEQSGSQFPGVELDLVFEENGGAPLFDVNHPPAESIELSLDEYLASRDEPGSLKYWLDIKNLTEANQEHVLVRLEWLMQRHRLQRERVIVESKEFMALRNLSDAGFLTSYYLPNLDPDTLTEAEKEDVAVRLARNARHSRVWAISYPGNESMLAFVKARLLPRLDGIRLLTWCSSRRIESYKDAIFVQSIVNDEAVSVVLVGHKTPYDR